MRYSMHSMYSSPRKSSKGKSSRARRARAHHRAMHDLGRVIYYKRGFYESDTGEVLPASRFTKEGRGYLDQQTGERIVGRGAAIDDSHAAFKRTDKIGPGPAGRVIEQRKMYECQKGPKEAGYYVQKCKILQGKRKGKTVTIKTSIEAKRESNRKQKAWRDSAEGVRSAFIAELPPKAGYRCRKTVVAKCAKGGKSAKKG